MKCKGWETDPNAYLYFIAQAPVWKAICKVIGKEQWITDPNYATPDARLPRLKEVFAAVEAVDRDQGPSSRRWNCSTSTTSPAVRSCRWKSSPTSPRCARPAPWSRWTIPTRGKYLTVGNPIKMSDSPTEVKRSPLLGEHTDEVLAELGYKPDEVRTLREKKVI